MNNLFRMCFVFSVLLATAHGGVVKIDLDGSGSGTFGGLGTTNATYTDTIQLLNEQTGAMDTFDLVLTLTGSDSIVLGATGLGVGDGLIDDGESLQFGFAITPALGTVSEAKGFQFTEIEHGITSSNFPTNFVTVGDGTNTNILANGSSGPTSISNLDGQSLTVTASGAPFSPGSVDGVSAISFDAVAAPEPSSVMMCGVFLIGFAGHRKRRR